jgi:TRAP-type C4-dicarboxylate transport system permease small subunit
MIVRIRFGRGTQVGKRPRKRRRFAAGVAGLLTPAAVLAAAFGAWGIAADMNWTGAFAIPAGLFSHWQVWLGGAIALQLCAHLLNRYAKKGEPAAT